MSTTVEISPTQLLVDSLYTGLEVYGEPRPKPIFGGDEQQSKGDLRAWTVTLIVSDGRLQVPRRVTLWTKDRPQISDGDTIRLGKVVIGAMDRNIYLNAYAYENISAGQEAK